VLKNRVPQEIEDVIVALAIEQPVCGQRRIANELKKRGSAMTWRHDQTRRLEAKSAQEGSGSPPHRPACAACGRRCIRAGLLEPFI
jgi:hypothetical protein